MAANNYEMMFSPCYINKLKIKNRVAMTSMGTSMADYDGQMSDRVIKMYEERAKGGIGLILTELACVEEEYGYIMNRQLVITDMMKSTPQLEKLAAAVHKYGTRVFVQLHHPGTHADPIRLKGKQAVSSSNVPSVEGIPPRPMTIEEIHKLQQGFINAAFICKTAGIDGVELHAAVDYLLHQFLSRYYNKRTDEYGGCLENRMRIITEIVTGIKEKCGKDFPVSLRINGSDYAAHISDEFITLEEAVETAKLAEKCGVDLINVSAGNYFTNDCNIEPYDAEEGWKKELGKTIKAAISIPVLQTNCVKRPSTVEALLQEGVCDMVAVTRGHLADPEFCNKTKEGREDEIRGCIGCLACINTEGLVPLQCAVNPRLSHEGDFAHLCKNGDNRPVAIIGSGPAGMEAAIILAKRGFDVTVFEKENQVGGSLNLANKSYHKEKITRLINTMSRQMELAGVKVKLNTVATPDLIAEMNPVGVFVAVGGVPVVPKSLCSADSRIYVPGDILSGKEQLAGSVAVIGSGLTGLETAEYLVDHGCPDVYIIDMADEIGPGVQWAVLKSAKKRIEMGNPVYMPSNKLVRVEKDAVVVESTKTGEQKTLYVNNVVLSMGVIPEKGIAEAFEKRFSRVLTIGDAGRNGLRIHEATFEGYSAGYAFLAE